MISPSKRGAMVELQAQALFLAAGFEVFANASPDGPADFVVWDGTVFYPIDTKKTQRYVTKDGNTSYTFQKTKQVEGVHYLGHCEGEWVWLTEPPAELNVL